jgi:hypothetical protein
VLLSDHNRLMDIRMVPAPTRLGHARAKSLTLAKNKSRDPLKARAELRQQIAKTEEPKPAVVPPVSPPNRPQARIEGRSPQLLPPRLPHKQFTASGEKPQSKKGINNVGSSPGKNKKWGPKRSPSKARIRPMDVRLNTAATPPRVKLEAFEISILDDDIVDNTNTHENEEHE